MKQGRTLTDLAAELERQAKSKRDFKAPTAELHAVVDGADLVNPSVDLRINGHGTFELTELAHDQLGQHAGIPSKYYDKMRSQAPNLLATNLNHWLHAEKETRLVRTLDGHARAFLSNRYRTIDNWDVAMAALPVLTKTKQMTVQSCEVTDNRLYLKVTSEKLTYEVKKGDVVQAGIVLSNSEVGLGSVRVEPFLYRLVCLNGAIVADSAIRKFHIGRAAAELEAAVEVFTDATRKADDHAFMLKLQDVVKAAFDEAQFDKLKGTIVDGTTRKVKKPIETITQVVETYHLPETYQEGLLARLIEGGDLSQWGVANAITNLANDAESYEEATNLERVGGTIMVLPAREWEQLAA